MVLSGASWPQETSLGRGAVVGLSVDHSHSMPYHRRGLDVCSASAARAQRRSVGQRLRKQPICNSDVAVSEEAWQLFTSILQAVRHDTFKDLTLFAQNPRGGLECIHMVLSEDELNQAQGLPVLLHQRALEDYARCDLRLCTLRSISSTRPLANLQRHH